LRIDENDKTSKISQGKLREICNNVFQEIFYDAIIISDYCKGFLSEEDIELIATRNNNVFLDTKKILGEWCNDVTFIKINHTEFDRTKHTIEYLGIYEKMIITRSHEGCEYHNELYPVEKVNIKDVSGAGDTFVAAFALKFFETLEERPSIEYANEIASIVVSKRGVVTPY
jgi:D-beta-D-heptose 7-phosphate kinase/D-beta-D-heptose 1-phosphate adenosyltransferase